MPKLVAPTVTKPPSGAICLFPANVYKTTAKPLTDYAKTAGGLNLPSKVLATSALVVQKESR